MIRRVDLKLFKEREIIGGLREYQKFGWKKNLYLQGFEDVLENFDDKYSKVIEKLENIIFKDKLMKLEGEDVGFLAQFVLLQMQRTHSSKAKVKENIELLKKDNYIYKNVPTLRDMYDATVFNPDLMQWESAPHIVNKLVQDILKFRWRFVYTKVDSFITSDNVLGLIAGEL